MASLPTAGAEAAPYRDGDPVVVTGLVTDPDGNPLPDVQVALRVVRSTFSVLELRRVERDSARVLTRSNDSGEYTLRWPWDRYYNSFELLVGVPVRRPEGESLRVFERLDITRRMLQGSPVVVTVVVEDAEGIRRLREFLATIRSDDQRRTYRQMGQPEKVETVHYPGHQEVSWWYFQGGQVFRFRDGRLEQVSRFDPVEGFSDP